MRPTYKELISKKMDKLSSIDELNWNSINKVLQPILDGFFNKGLKVKDYKRRKEESYAIRRKKTSWVN